MCVCNSSTTEWRWADPRSSPVSFLAKWASFRFRQRHCFEVIRWRAIGEDIRHISQASEFVYTGVCTCILTCMCHTHTHTEPPLPRVFRLLLYHEDGTYYRDGWHALHWDKNHLTSPSDQQMASQQERSPGKLAVDANANHLGTGRDRGREKAGPGLQSVSGPHCLVTHICMLICFPTHASRSNWGSHLQQ